MMLGMHAYSMTHPLTLVIAIVLYYSSAVVTHNRFISQPRPPSFLLAVAVTRASRGGECRLLYPQPEVRPLGLTKDNGVGGWV